MFPMLQDNAAALERLRSLLEGLTDAELAMALGEGWTVGAILGHLAFWDRRALILIQQWERDGILKPSSYDATVINDAMKAHCLALPPRDAANLALLSAEAIERKIASLDDGQLTALTLRDIPFAPNRAPHWNEHITEIEQALARGA